MASLDMHPDVIRAINSLANSKLGQRFDRLARQRYGVSGKVLAAKQITGESGGSQSAVSSAGARGIAQFIPSTRQEMIRRYGVDPYAGPKQAVKALELYDLQRGVAGYNPGMPTYTNYVLGQKLSGQTQRALKAGDGYTAGDTTIPGPTSHTVTQSQRTVPGQSLAPERKQLADQLLLSGGPLTMSKLLAYKQQLDQMRDVPAITEPGQIKVTKHQGPSVDVGAPGNVPSGQILELIHNDGPGRPGYGIKNGQVVNGSQVFAGVWAGHANHVHVAANPKLVVRLGKLAQSMGLHVGENPHFGGVNPAAHVPNSYHDRGMAIDVSGPAGKMDKFAQLVEQVNHQG